MGARSKRGVGLACTSLLAFAVVTSACSNSPSGTSATSTSNPPSYRVLVDAGLHLYREHNINAAEQLFFQAIRRDRRMPYAYYDLGVLYQSEGHEQAALAQFMHAATVSPGYVPALYNEAVIEGKLRPIYAMSLYRHVIALQPDSPTAFLNLGLLELAAHERTRAIHDLRQAVHLQPALMSRVPKAVRSEVR